MLVMESLTAVTCQGIFLDEMVAIGGLLLFTLNVAIIHVFVHYSSTVGVVLVLNEHRTQSVYRTHHFICQIGFTAFLDIFSQAFSFWLMSPTS